MQSAGSALGGEPGVCVWGKTRRNRMTLLQDEAYCGGERRIELGGELGEERYYFATNLRCGAMRCGAVRCAAMRYNTKRYDTIRNDTIQYETIRYEIILYCIKCLEQSSES